MKKPKIGLALSGGGARGLAHIGVLKVLEKAGIPVDLLSGTSIGGLIAAIFAAGFPSADIEARALEITRPRTMVKLIDLSPARRGLLEGNRVKTFITDLIGEEAAFEDLQIPLSLMAVDLLTAQEIVLTQGALLPAVMATMSVPGIFRPVPLGEYQLIDGGVLNNVPTDLVRKMGADIVIAVDVQTDPHLFPSQLKLPHKSIFPVSFPETFLDFYNAEIIMISAITHFRLDQARPDVLIRPPIPSDVNIFIDFHRAAEIISYGERAARLEISRIKQLIQDF